MKKYNKKGMTLVEVIVAMTILGIMSALFVSVAVAAKKQNKDNAKRSAEMYEQAAAAENYDPTKEYSTEDIKVSKFLSTGTSNTFTIRAEFEGYDLKTDVYGYKVNRMDEDTKSEGYRLRFFKSQNADIVPTLEPGEYWVKVINESGAEIDLFTSTPDGRLLNSSGTSLGSEFTQLLPNKGMVDFVFKPGDEGLENLFGFSTNEGLFEPEHAISGWDRIITRSEFPSLLDVNESGEVMSTITLYFYEGQVISKATYESLKSGS